MGMLYFQVEEEKADKINQHLEKGIQYIEKAMGCLNEMMQGGTPTDHEPGMGYRDDDDNMIGERMGFRRGVRGTGPYSRMNRRMPVPSYREPYMM